MINKILEKKIKKEWKISYDPYSDLFQIFDDIVFELPKRHLIISRKKNKKLLFNQNYTRPVLFEITNAYTEFGKNIEDLNKNDIIKLVMPKIGDVYANTKK